jgi:membrane protein YqaA with SNARE-associated domain
MSFGLCKAERQRGCANEFLSSAAPALLTLAALFLTAFAAATILPMQSEALLTAMILAGDHSLIWLIAVAGTGNTLGAAFNWWLGGRIETYRDRSWFPVSRRQLEKAQAWYQRWGKYSLLLSWLPFGGDALTVAAGLMRERLPVFIALVALGKFGRYIVLALLVREIF